MIPPHYNSSDFDREMYFSILRNEPPLTRYVSRGDTRDEIDVPNPHKDADRAIFRAVRFTMKDGTPRFQPVLGGAGSGKTHLFWVLKDQENYFAAGNFLAVYVPSPPSPVRVPLHLHACLVDEAGDAIFEQTVDMLIQKFGGLKGVTHEIYDYTYALERLLVDYPGISADVVKILLRYRLDPATQDLARRWLFGDALNEHEIERLGVRTILEEDDVTLATFKLLTEGSEVPIVLFIDEMEGPYNSYGEQGERHFLEILKRIYNETKNTVIIASCLSDVWERVYNIADGPMRSRMEAPVELALFTGDDIALFVKDTMSKYWQLQNIEPPPDPLFPFTQSIIDEAYSYSKGNPREAIKYLIPQLDFILFEKPISEAEPQEDYVIKLTSTVVTNTLIEVLKIIGDRLGVEVKPIIDDEPSQKQKSMIARLERDGVVKYIGIDVPNVKDWDRSGGVAAFYAANRLKSILDDGSVDGTMIAVPTETKGAKFDAILKEISSKILTLRFDDETGTTFVQEANAGILPHGYAEAITGLIDELFV
ncbi:hypothetical protein EU527_12230 [Candidatus Thorarchaeota archaeon]|nr:MAG: hypothetical protein EU527_12230 [Candidatus Thorarchaeota archaeon]